MRKIPLLVYALACTPFLALAQIGADDVSSSPLYRSAFKPDFLTAPKASLAPSDWTQSNAAVGRNPRGHIDILQWDQQQDRARPDVPPMGGAGVLLAPQQALKLALMNRPELFARPGMNALEQEKLAARVRQVGYQVQRAWINAVAAQQELTLMRERHDNAMTGLDLAQRMVQAGNWSQMRLLQEQAVASASALQLAMAQQLVFGSMERLIQLLGQSESASLTVPKTLPDLPETALLMPDLEALALRNKPALALANRHAQRALAGVSPQEVDRWKKAMSEAINTFVSTNNPTSDAGLPHAPTSAPWLDDRRLVLGHALEQAVEAQAGARALEVRTRSQAREAYFRYRSALDVARHSRDDGVRIASALQEETQTRYNGMMQSTWDLLASARARVQSINAAVRAQRDFWLAHTDLQAVLNGADLIFSDASAASGVDTAPSQGH